MLESFDRAHPAPVTVSCVLQSPEVDVSRIIFSSLVVPLTESVVKAVLKSVLMGPPWAALVVVVVVPILCECRTTESRCCSKSQSHRSNDSRPEAHRSNRIAHGIDQDRWVVVHVPIEIEPAIKRNWVLIQESADVLVIVPMPVFVDSGFWVELPPGVLERISERACGGGQLAERIVGVGFGECSR